MCLALRNALVTMIALSKYVSNTHSKKIIMAKIFACRTTVTLWELPYLNSVPSKHRVPNKYQNHVLITVSQWVGQSIAHLIFLSDLV